MPRWQRADKGVLPTNQGQAVTRLSTHMGGDSIRGGVRGGRDQFNWEDVKQDKHREYYLGASVKASVGRWQKNRDILWYTRDGDGNGDGGAAAAAQQAAMRDELAAVKAEEERLMQEALGLRPVTQRRGAGGLDAAELQQMLKRGAGVDGTEEGEAPGGGAGGGGGGDATRVKGVGYTPAVAERLKASGKQLKTGEEFATAERLAGTAAAGGLEGGAHPGAGPAGRRARHDSDDDEQHDDKRSESDSAAARRRRARKEAKRARKEAKASKRGRHSRSRSRSRERRRSRSRSRDRRDHHDYRSR